MSRKVNYRHATFDRNTGFQMGLRKLSDNNAAAVGGYDRHLGVNSNTSDISHQPQQRLRDETHRVRIKDIRQIIPRNICSRKEINLDNCPPSNIQSMRASKSKSKTKLDVSLKKTSRSQSLRSLASKHSNSKTKIKVSLAQGQSMRKIKSFDIIEAELRRNQNEQKWQNCEASHQKNQIRVYHMDTDREVGLSNGKTIPDRQKQARSPSTGGNRRKIKLSKLRS